jgi:hypothetical protein
MIGFVKPKVRMPPRAEKVWQLLSVHGVRSDLQGMA